jgi:hypothetical protein
MPFWDVLYRFRGLRPVAHWVKAYQGLGVKITEREINTRSADWVERALASCRI